MELNDNVKLLQGDCLELLKKVNDESVDAIITDPPYFLGMTHNSSKGVFNDLVICKPFYQKLFEEYKRILKKDRAIYFFTDWRSIAFYYPIFDFALGVKNVLIWEKLGRPTLNHYGFGYEMLLFSGRIKASNVTNIIKGFSSFNKANKNFFKKNGKKVHPTQKPIALIEKLINDSTNEGDTILDTFMGSGTTGVACINTNRRFIGMEVDEVYFTIAQERCMKATHDKNNELFNGTGAV